MLILDLRGEYYEDESDQDFKETKLSSFRSVQIQKTVHGIAGMGLSSSFAITSNTPLTRAEREREIRDKEKDRD